MSTTVPLPSSPKSLAIAGATGAVGREFIKVLTDIDYPVKDLKLLSSARSAGTVMEFKGEKITVEEMTEDSFKDVDIALFSAGSSISKQFEKAVVDSGAVMVDNSSAFRMREGTPLVIPEINPEDAKNHRGVIANPNCSTIIMLMVVYPLHRAYPVKRIICSTYQAASGGGWAVMDELEKSTEAYLKGEVYTPKELPHPYAFNLFSHNSAIDESGYNEEERKMINETHKILHTDKIGVSATCVRVPILRAHSEAINIEFENSVPPEDEIRKLLAGFPGVQVIDDREKNHFPMPNEASEKHDTLVGRIRKDPSHEKAVDLFTAGDQLLKGAALNAVQIACLL